MRNDRPGLLLLTALLLFAAAVSSATSASAQERARSTTPPARSADILCFEALDAGATESVVRALVHHEVEIVHDAQTNCLVVVGATDLSEARRVVSQLEARMRDRRSARTRRRGRHRPAG